MDLGLRELTPTDISNLFLLFDKRNAGSINYDEFIEVITVCVLL
jgi:hypothetical protein